MKNRETGMNRRQFLKGTGMVAGATVGYGLSDLLGNSFCDSLVDAYTELTGVVEKRMLASAQEVKQYLGETEEAQKKMTRYWDGILGGFEVESKELRTALDNIDRYVTEADMQERLKRLYDRVLLRYRMIIDVEQEVHKQAPKGLQRLQEGISRFWHGEEKGSNEHLRKRMGNLESLVQVYDNMQTSGLGQVELMKETSSYFKQAQDQVVKQLNAYLADKNLSEEERLFYQGLQNLAGKDPTGKTMADYLLNSGAQLRTADVAQSLDKLKGALSKTIGDLTKLQSLYDEGLTLKKELRDLGKDNIGGLQRKVEEYTALVEQRKNELKSDGYAVNYSVAPEWGAFGENLFGFLGKVKKYLSVGIAGAGAVAGVYLGGMGSRLLWGNETKELKREIESLKENIRHQK